MPSLDFGSTVDGIVEEVWVEIAQRTERLFYFAAKSKYRDVYR